MPRLRSPQHEGAEHEADRQQEQQEPVRALGVGVEDPGHAASSATPTASAAISSATAERRVRAARAATPASTSDVQTMAPGGSVPHTSVSRAPEPPEPKSAPRASASRSRHTSSRSSPVTISTDW